MISTDTQATKSLGINEANEAHDHLLSLGDVTVRLSEIERAPRYIDGDRETDVEHSFHLALSATELAASYYPELDVGLVSQFSLVHDLPEIYAGDVWTFNISDENLIKKIAAEKEALERLVKELPPYAAHLLTRYEEQLEPEARFVRFVDKLLPSVINVIASETSTFKEDHGINTLEELNQKVKERMARLQQMFPEFPFIYLVYELLSKTSQNHIF